VLSVDYHAAHFVSDCEAIQKEVREVWMAFASREAETVRATTVIISPGDTTGRSIAFVFDRNTDGEWSEPPLLSRRCPW